MTTDPAVAHFLSLKRLAVVGVSRNPRDFSRSLFRELQRRGYDVVPVNPLGGTIEGLTCWRTVHDIDPSVAGALLMTAPAITERVVRECAEAGIASVWMHRGAGNGAVSPAAVAYCREHGINVVAGACPYMFLARSGFIHQLHGFLQRIARRSAA